jgi:hypothetical protein
MKYACEKCEYFTSNMKDWEKHLNTKKHRKETKLLQCPFCLITLGSRTSLWRHKKSCIESKDVNTRLLEAIKENTRVNNELLENKFCINNSQCSNVTNNIVTINMFLNDECGSAMSIQNFIRGMNVTFEDLCKNKRDSLTNIVIRNLQPLSITERPVHCKDTRNWYIKDELCGWNEDSGEGLLKAAEFGIQRAWQKEFERKHPEWMETDKLRELYVELAGTSSSEILCNDRESILKTISEKVMIQLPSC